MQLLSSAIVSGNGTPVVFMSRAGPPAIDPGILAQDHAPPEWISTPGFGVNPSATLDAAGMAPTQAHLERVAQWISTPANALKFAEDAGEMGMAVLQGRPVAALVNAVEISPTLLRGMQQAPGLMDRLRGMTHEIGQVAKDAAAMGVDPHQVAMADWFKPGLMARLRTLRGNAEMAQGSMDEMGRAPELRPGPSFALN